MLNLISESDFAKEELLRLCLLVTLFGANPRGSSSLGPDSVLSCLLSEEEMLFKAESTEDILGDEGLFPLLVLCSLCSLFTFLLLRLRL